MERQSGKRWSGILGIVLGALVASPASSPARGAAGEQAEALEWLNRMAVASRTLSYDATFVYRNGDWMESMRLIHRLDPDGERERLVSLTGVPREVLRQADRVIGIFPDERIVVVAKSGPRPISTATMFAPEAGFERHYRLRTGPGERVAGRETRFVEVEPRDHHRFGYRIALDVETGLLLGAELVDGHGRTLEQVVYTSIEAPAEIPDELLRPGISAEGFRWFKSERTPPLGAMSQGRHWAVEWLPDGFALSNIAREPFVSDRRPVEHLAYSDGLAAVSVFVEQVDEGIDGQEGLSNMGAVNAFGRVVDGYQVTVIGELPAEAIRRIGESVRRR